MTKNDIRYNIDYDILKKGCELFVKNEERNPMYKVANYLVNTFWGDSKEVTDGLGVLLLTWNQALYRYNSFDFNQLQKVIEKNENKIENFRKRSIFSFNEFDIDDINKIFLDFLEALSVTTKNKKIRSPVGTGKALHILAPDFFPLWDGPIAKEYGCGWNNPVIPEKASASYLKFMKISQIEIKKIVDDYLKKFNVNEKIAENDIREKCSNNSQFKKTLLKLFDEYNYARFTKKWFKA